MTAHQEKLVHTERLNVQFVPVDIMSARTTQHAIHVILESTVIKIYKHQQVHAKYVRKEHTRQRQVSPALMIATSVPPERRITTMVPIAARRVSVVISTPKQRRQVRPHVLHVVWVEILLQEVQSVRIARTAEQRVMKVNRFIVPIAKLDFMLPLVMILAMYARLVSIKIKA